MAWELLDSALQGIRNDSVNHGATLTPLAVNKLLNMTEEDGIMQAIISYVLVRDIIGLQNDATSSPIRSKMKPAKMM